MGHITSHARQNQPFSKFRSYLLKELSQRCDHNAKYSLRGFAKALGVDTGALSRVLNGKRPFTASMVKRIGAKLNLSPAQINTYLGNASDAVGSAFKPTAEEVFSTISEWHHFAIIELIMLPGSIPDKSWIGRRLGLNANIVGEALDRLQRVGLLKLESDGRWTVVEADNSFAIDEYTSSARRQLQKRFLELAVEAIDSVPFELRDNSGLTVGVNPEDVADIARMIAEFRSQVMSRLKRSARAKKEVYQLSLAFFPLSRAAQTPVPTPTPKEKRKSS